MGQEKASDYQAILGSGGMVGPVLFSLAAIVLGFFEPGYNHIRDPVSALGEAGAANPVLQSANFIVFGLLVIGLAVGLSRAVNHGEGNKIGYLLLGGFGLVALILSGVFPADAGGATITFSGKAHQAVAGIGFLLGLISIFLVRRELVRDDAWRDLGTYTLLTGLVAVPLLVLFGSQISSPNAPLHDAAGLLQRLFILTLFQWFFVMGNRLRKLSQSGG